MQLTHQLLGCQILSSGSSTSAMLHLRFHPYSFPEMIIGVAYAQRLYLDALSYTDYVVYQFED